jgi:hypothetical protein
MNITRRTLFGTAAATLALAACAGQTTSQLQADVTAIATGVQSVVTDLAATPGVHVPPATLAEINTTLATIKADAAQIGATLAPGQSVVTEFSMAVNDLVPLLTPYFPAAPAVAATVQAAVTLAQVVLSEAGVTKVAATDPASVAQARLVLRGAALRAVTP